MERNKELMRGHITYRQSCNGMILLMSVLHSLQPTEQWDIGEQLLNGNIHVSHDVVIVATYKMTSLVNKTVRFKVTSLSSTFYG